MLQTIANQIFKNWNILKSSFKIELLFNDLDELYFHVQIEIQASLHLM